MTDSSGVEGLEHFLAVGGLIFTGVVGLLAWASGSKEGKSIVAETDRASTVSATAAAVGGAAGAGLIDLSAYRAVIEGLEAIQGRLDRLVPMDTKLARLVELGENQDERESGRSSTVASLTSSDRRSAPSETSCVPTLQRARSAEHERSR